MLAVYGCNLRFCYDCLHIFMLHFNYDRVYKRGDVNVSISKGARKGEFNV